MVVDRRIYGIFTNQGLEFGYGYWEWNEAVYEAEYKGSTSLWFDVYGWDVRVCSVLLLTSLGSHIRKDAILILHVICQELSNYSLFYLLVVDRVALPICHVPSK